jgi:pimeloyl-ACP methyl ester carboxylesterase
MILRRARRSVVPALAVSAMAALAPALTTAPASAAPGTVTTPLTRQTPDWKACGDPAPASVRCATLKVPLDHLDPGGRTIDVEISRRKAADPAQRRGILLLNPGGPSAPGLGMPYDPALPIPKAVTDRYDLIGFDPRGIGRSTSLACGLAEDERELARPYRAAGFAADVAETRRVAEKCRAKYGDALQHFTTRNTARDMDLIRAVLGERRLSFLGYSYGTYLGAVFTELFPHRGDRIVLDSAVDPALAWWKDTQLYATEAEKAYARWTKWAAAHHAEYALGRTPGEVSRTFWRIVEQADRTPIRVGDHTYDGATLRDRMRPLFSSVRMGSEWTARLRLAAAGQPVGGFDEFVPDDRTISSYLAVTCGDAAFPRDPETYRRLAERNSVRYPLYGDHAFNITPCAFWDPPAERPTRVRNGSEALILQNEWDPQTPVIGARGLREKMRDSRLVLVKGGEGHGVYNTPVSRCANEIATAYLAEGRHPARDVSCAADPVGTPARDAEDGPPPVPVVPPRN